VSARHQLRERYRDRSDRERVELVGVCVLILLLKCACASTGAIHIMQLVSLHTAKTAANVLFAGWSALLS